MDGLCHGFSGVGGCGERSHVSTPTGPAFPRPHRHVAVHDDGSVATVSKNLQSHEARGRGLVFWAIKRSKL